MSFSFSGRTFATKSLQACPGDVFVWYRPEPIGKRKFHLCLSYDYDFVFLNTPKDRAYPSDYYIRAVDLHFLKPTATRVSSVSCANLQAIGSEVKFRSAKPERLGNLATDVLLEVLRHIHRSGTATEEEAERLAETIRTLKPALSSRMNTALQRTTGR